MASDKIIATSRVALNSIILSFSCRQDLQDVFKIDRLILKNLVNPVSN